MSDAALGTIRLVAFDIDGVFTDGRFYLSDEGIESKAFHTQDGYGVRKLLDAGIAVAVISGRSSGAVAKRMAELKVRHVVLGVCEIVHFPQSLINQLNKTEPAIFNSNFCFTWFSFSRRIVSFQKFYHGLDKKVRRVEHLVKM